MGPLSTPPLAFAPLTDERCQSGAYLTLNGRLYEAVTWEAQSPTSGKLHVINCATEHPLWLTGTEVQHSRLVRAAPPVEIPADWQATGPVHAWTAADGIAAWRERERPSGGPSENAD